MKLRNISFLLIILASSSSFAKSGGAGNGGDTIVCPDQVQLLDSYEAEKMRLTINLMNGKINPSLRSMVNVAVDRLAVKDNYTASLLRKYSYEMVGDFEAFEVNPSARGKFVYLGHDIIAEINDSEHVSTPEGCEEHPRQLVSQKVPRFSFEYRYEISQTLWDQMEIQEQAMTILHEAWYRIMLENGATTSRAARYMNALVASEEFELLTFAEYLKELKGTELESYVIKNNSSVIRDEYIVVDLKTNEVSNEGTMACVKNFVINMSIKETFSVFNQAQKYPKGVKLQQVCFENSVISKVVLSTEYFKMNTTLRLPFYQLELGTYNASSPTVFFHGNGKMSHFENINFKSLTEMFYRCNGKISYTERQGCRGPFNNKETKVSKPINIQIDNTENLVNYFNRN
jgi:hypothetical protein